MHFGTLPLTTDYWLSTTDFRHNCPNTTVCEVSARLTSEIGQVNLRK